MIGRLVASNANLAFLSDPYSNKETRCSVATMVNTDLNATAVLQVLSRLQHLQH